MHERAGRAAYYAARLADARAHLEQALEIRENDGDIRGAARARVALAEVAFWDHRASQAIDLLHDAVGVLTQGEHDADLARAVAELSRYLTLAGRHDEAIPLIERSLERTGGNKGQAARLLGLKRTTLVEKLKRFANT